MIKTKSLFYEMRMRKTHVIVVYARIRTLHIANVLSLMASHLHSNIHVCYCYTTPLLLIHIPLLILHTM